MTLSDQFLTMITMILAGLYLGIVQETFRRFTPYWKNNQFFTYVLEISFWITQTFILFYVLFLVNGGELRFYVFLAILLGFSIYQVFIKRIYKRLLERIIQVIAAVYRFFVRFVQALIITPIKWIIKTLISIVLGLASAILTILFFILKVVFTPFKWLFMFIYRLLPQKFKNFLYKIAGLYSKIWNRCKQWIKRR